MNKIYLAVTMVGLLTLVGFDYSKHNIPLDEIHDGGPSKDGIPALLDSQFIRAEEADYLNPNDRILGVSLNGESKAYPIRILNWHELVNDRVGGEDILVTYCPLCGTGIVFNAQISGKRMLFGVSGKLYNSDVLFYDKTTESLWSQLMMEAVTGPLTGQKLSMIPAAHTTWQDWQEKHPDTRVLSSQTGYTRNYELNPYSSYGQSQEILFPVRYSDQRLPAKSWVIGIILDGRAKAYSVVKLRNGPLLIQDIVGGIEIEIDFDSTHQNAIVTDKQGREIPSIQSYWFAWSAFYPDTKLYF